MRPLLLLLGSIIAITLIACDKSDEDSISGVQPTDERELLLFEELSSDSIPPCLSYAGADFEIVLTDTDDYESIRRLYAPQGGYVDFEADGIQRSFRFPYLPLDINNDGIIGPNEVIIYVKGRPLYTDINGEKIIVSANPVRMDGDSILIFLITPPYTIDRKIHYKKVFTIDPVTGEIIFNVPPQEGSKISISAMRRLYETYSGRECTMQYFDFTKHIIIGKSILGNGCLKGFEKELFLDNEQRQLIYSWHKIEDDPQNGCPAVATQYISWIRVDRPPEGYNVFIRTSISPKTRRKAKELVGKYNL